MFTVEQVIGKVRELAEEYPNAVYQQVNCGGCCYTIGNVKDGPGCGCIFGQAIKALGGELHETYNNIDCKYILKGFTDIPRAGYLLYEKFNLKLSISQESWCNKVQMMQDDGKTWSQAVAYADGFGV